MTTLPSSAMARIRTIARTMKYVIGTGLCLTASALVAVWGVPELTNAFVLSLNLTPDQVTLSNSARAGGALIMLVPFSVLFLLLLRAFSLFRLYEQGEIFAASAIHQLRKIASGLISLAVLSPVTRTLLVLDLTLGNPPGHRLLSIGISGTDYLLAAFGGLLLAISWVMVEAASLSAENKEFV